MFNTINSFSAIDAILLVLALSTDAFVASFAYGTNKIKIPFKSAMIINVICSGALGISLVMGNIISHYISNVFTTSICVIILFLIGFSKLFDSTLKSILCKSSSLSRDLSFKVFDFKFFLRVCLDSTEADIDHSYELSPKEALSLAIALSLDGIAAGFSTGLITSNYFQIILFSLLINFMAILFGCVLGNKIAEKLNFNLSWLSGITLILLAVLKLR